MSDDLNKTISELGTAFEEFKATHAQEIKELKQKGSTDPLTTEKLGKIEHDLSSLEEIKKRLEAAEVKLDRPGSAKDGARVSPEEAKHIEAFDAWVRSPADPERKQALQAAALESKAVSSSTSTGAGHAIPEIIGARIYEQLQQESPMRRVLNVITVGSSDYKELVDVNGETSGWVGETGSRTATDTPILEQVAPTMGELFAYPSIYEHILDDAFFNVQSWLINKVSGEFARKEGEAFISGNGTNKPTGFLDPTPVSTGDFDSPARTFGIPQYVATGNADGLGTLSTTSPEFYPGDVFFDTIHALRPRWRQGAVWLMNTTTKGVLRKLKDSEGNYLMRQGLETGEGNMLLGYRIEEMDHMPDIAANAFPIAFGNWSEAYMAVERIGLRITTDDNITAPGQVKFYVRRRLGGKLRNDQALKLIKCAAS